MEPVLVIKPNRFIFLIMAFIALGMSLVFAVFAVIPDLFSDAGPFSSGEQLSIMEIIIFGFFCLLGLFLCFVWVKMFLKDTAAIAIYKNGFEANTNGISTGFIAWTDIEMLEEVLVSSNSGSGTGKEAALAVYLKDPSVYTQRLPLFFQWATKLAGKSGRYSHTNKYGVTEDTPPIFLPFASFGTQYEEAKKLMYAGVKQKTG